MITLKSPMANWFSKADPSKPTKSVKDKTLSGLGNLIKLLPTGTVFVFQFLNPVLTNNGHCEKLNKQLSGILIALCGLSCCFSCFTDSYTGLDNKLHYGIVTIKGLWPSNDAETVDLSKYKLRLGDFVHAFFSMVVFGVLCLLDANTMHCFYPSFESSEMVLTQVLPVVIGAVSSAAFVIFPNNRHGIGYPPAPSSEPDKPSKPPSSN